MAISDTITGGRAGSAGEFGHIQVPGLSELCHCGKRGCIETAASVPAVCAAAGVTSLEELAQAVKEESSQALEAVRQAAQIVGQNIGAIVLVANPQIVVCSGSLVRAIPHIVSLIERAVIEYVPSVLQQSIHVKAGKLGHRGAALGAAFAADFAVEADAFPGAAADKYAAQRQYGLVGSTDTVVRVRRSEA